MMNLSHKEQTELCGQAIIDFTNAPTTDEACLSLIPKIKRVFDFSINFEKKAEESFPYLNSVLGTLNDKQRNLVSLNFNIWTFDEFVDDFHSSFVSKVYLYDESITPSFFEPLVRDLWNIGPKRIQRYYNSKKIDEILFTIKKVQPLLKNAPFHWGG